MFTTQSQTYVVEPVGTSRRELSQTALSTFNIFHERQMIIASIEIDSLREKWIRFPTLS